MRSIKRRIQIECALNKLLDLYSTKPPLNALNAILILKYKSFFNLVIKMRGVRCSHIPCVSSIVCSKPTDLDRLHNSLCINCFALTILLHRLLFCASMYHFKSTKSHANFIGFFECLSQVKSKPHCGCDQAINFHFDLIHLLMSSNDCLEMALVPIVCNVYFSNRAY